MRFPTLVRDQENSMPELTASALEDYLSKVFGSEVSVLGMSILGMRNTGDALKNYGYGVPVRIDYRIGKNAPSTAVFHTMRPNQFGHEHRADRAQIHLWEHEAFNHLPKHVRSIDVGAFQSDGSLLSLGKTDEVFLLSEYADGIAYNLDLERLRNTNELTELDLARADALCDYLVEIHRTAGPDPGLYLRRIRELVGHGECIMGLADSYPQHLSIPASLLEEIEHRCIRWRWKLKRRAHRLRQVHGDFHPWNILFATGAEFRVLDRSRGEWGDPADDVASITANYLFFSLQRSGRLEGALENLFSRFWDRYLRLTGDREVLEVIAPFYAFRGLVMASPVWYPDLEDVLRQTLLTFIVSVLGAGAFDPARVNTYCGR
jgi:streptomycin 6-kinase